MKTIVRVLGLSLGTVLVGCTESEELVPAVPVVPAVPADPGYAADVQPILLANCVRCHGAGGTLNADPTSLKVNYRVSPSMAFFDAYEDRGTCPDLQPVCKRGAAYFATPEGRDIIDAYLHPTDPADRMPPEPAPALTERELQILDRWLSKSPPKP